MAERARIQAEKARARRQRYEDKVRRGRHDLNESRIGGHKRDIHYRDYQFVMWDGEAPQDTGYSLFGSSLGHEVCYPKLTTEDCFDLMIQAKKENPHTIFVWYGGRYDWDEITRSSIPLMKLARLKTHGVLWWHNYRLTECEGKIYSVAKDGICAKIFEISGWFHSPYVEALKKYGIGTKDQLESMASEKNRRAEFLWSEIEEIREYMRLELALGPDLMDVIRKICLDAGFDPRGWYGPSALARQALTKNKIFDSMSKCPDEVNEAACIAFAGGRFEPFRGGIIGYNCTADQNSAYMHAALDLPNLAKGSWRKGQYFEPEKFAVYHIKYNDNSRPFNVTKPNPLFRRLNNGNVQWPRKVDGWYWSPEAELVHDSPYAEFVESWVFDEDNRNDRPFSFVQKMYQQRLAFQALPESNPSHQAEKAFKWALASIYGQLARAVGWDKKKKLPPRTHQIEWAGYILSKCRATMFNVALACGDNLVSIDTDSVTSLAPIIVEEGTALGQWKTEHHEWGIFFQNGVYFTCDDYKWSKGKTRGMERKRGVPAVSPQLLADAIRSHSDVKMKPKRRYITTKMALNGQLSKHGQWIEHPGNVLRFGGGGKRYHNETQCAVRCSGDVHVMFPRVITGKNVNPFDVKSYPHLLPWKMNYREVIDTDLMDDVLWINTDTIDDDDKWEAELVRKAVA